MQINKRITHSANTSGFSIFELLVVLIIFAILSASVMSNVKEINRPLTNASFELTHFLRLARSRAISQTTFIKVAPLSAFKLAAYTGESCATTTTAINNLTLDLPDNTNLIATDWSICFSPRGLTPTSTTFTISDENNSTRVVEIALGGGVRMQ
jgi:prepilin-type N-terminal cleavage/methylation domain-containing protein